MYGNCMLLVSLKSIVIQAKGGIIKTENVILSCIFMMKVVYSVLKELNGIKPTGKN